MPDKMSKRPSPIVVQEDPFRKDFRRGRPVSGDAPKQPMLHTWDRPGHACELWADCLLHNHRHSAAMCDPDYAPRSSGVGRLVDKMSSTSRRACRSWATSSGIRAESVRNRPKQTWPSSAKIACIWSKSGLNSFHSGPNLHRGHSGPTRLCNPWNLSPHWPQPGRTGRGRARGRR